VPRSTNNHQSVPLGVRCLVRRGPQASLRLDDSRGSGEHASIYWLHGAWKVRDLGGSAGTRLNQRALELGVSRQLEEGDILAFGSGDQTWVLEDATAPGPAGWHAEAGRIEGQKLCSWLPDDCEPGACVSIGGQSGTLEKEG